MKAIREEGKQGEREGGKIANSKPKSHLENKLN